MNYCWIMLLETFKGLESAEFVRFYEGREG